jgi:hypothetical protein
MSSNSAGAAPLGDAVIREIRRLWGGQLVPAPRDLVARHDLSPATATLLSEVGLPTDDPLEIEYFRDDRLLDRTETDGEMYLGIADETGTLFALRAGTDELWCLNPMGNPPTMFVNSTLCDFLLFWGRVAARFEDFTHKDTVAEAVDALRRELAARDPRALDEADGWWRLVLAQALEGEL